VRSRRGCKALSYSSLFQLKKRGQFGEGDSLKVEDFHIDDDDATLKILEKGRGRSKRAIGLHFAAFVTGGPGRRLLAGPPLWFRSGSFWQRFAQLPLVGGLVAMRSPAT